MGLLFPSFVWRHNNVVTANFAQFGDFREIKATIEFFAIKVLNIGIAPVFLFIK